jgi:hypothetical protein
MKNELMKRPPRYFKKVWVRPKMSYLATGNHTKLSTPRKRIAQWVEINFVEAFP